ncbi:MAG TPA: alcohol dehydrogenase catalytic domain-containing protein [Dermatophilaceae bacterium]
MVPGHEVVGEVVQLGDGAGRFRTGDRVGIAWLRHTCGACRWCRTGRENLCPESRYTGWDADGGMPSSPWYRRLSPTGCRPRSRTSRPRRSCAPGSSGTAPRCAHSYLPEVGWGSTGSEPARTSPRRWPSPRARRCTS